MFNTPNGEYSFHHGGRIGDLILALYTMKSLGGGRLYLSPRQYPGWNIDMAREMYDFLIYQSYISKVDYIYTDDVKSIDEIATQFDYDLVDAERLNNPNDFPEWIGPDWPGNIKIAKRYAQCFNIEYDGTPWLQAPKTRQVDIVFHAPQRRLARKVSEWYHFLYALVDRNFKIAIVDHLNEWVLQDVKLLRPTNYLVTADYINSAKLVLGASSSCGACAEGLGIPRLLELAPGHNNISPTHIINDWTQSQIIGKIIDICQTKN